jgi:hypothetical protein
MPGTRKTQGNDGPIPGPLSALAQAISRTADSTSSASLQTANVVLDQYQNVCLILGNLAQVVTIGAGWISSSPVQGVEVGTGLTSFGLAYPSGFAYSLITTTKNSTTATLTGGTTGFTNGYVIGATVYQTPSGTQATAPPNYIAPGTTYTISGSTVTLSVAALLSGTGLYVCTCTWNQLGSANAFSNVHP